MKKLIKFALVFLLLFSLRGIAQEPGDTYPLADKSTLKGEKELRRENRIKRHSKRNSKKQERLAISRSNNKKYTVRLFPAKRKKAKKTKENKKEKAASKG